MKLNATHMSPGTASLTCHMTVDVSPRCLNSPPARASASLSFFAGPSAPDITRFRHRRVSRQPGVTGYLVTCFLVGGLSASNLSTHPRRGEGVARDLVRLSPRPTTANRFPAMPRV